MTRARTPQQHDRVLRKFDGKSAQQHPTFEQRLERSIAQTDVGDLIDADDVLEELNRS